MAVWTRSRLARVSGVLLGLCCLAACDASDSQSSATLPTPIAQSAPAKASLPVGEGFDFYVLSLSWSPSYCEAEGEDANQQQCGSSRPYAFVVHGLWPQFERGWPENCGAEPPNVAQDLLRSLYDIMPSAGLIHYQWRKHGGCAGLSQDDYFAVLRAAREHVVVPAEFRQLPDYRTIPPLDVEKAFIESNPGLAAQGSAVTCDERYLREIRLCMTKALEFRS